MSAATFPRRKIGANIWIGGTLSAVFVIVATLAPLLAPYNPLVDANLVYSQDPPSLSFWLGCDSQGRDLLSMLMYGSRVSISIGLLTQLVNTVIGVSLGLSAAFFGKRWDDFVTALTNVMLSIPSLVFALAIIAALGPGVFHMFLAISLTNWCYTCRITRSQALALRNSAFVKAAEAIGENPIRIMLAQILPNILGPIVVIGTLGIGSAIMMEASLSFLGLGVQAPNVSWGSMLSSALQDLFSAPWISAMPGIAIFAAVLAFNLLGDGLRDLLDPHTGGRAK